MRSIRDRSNVNYDSSPAVFPSSSRSMRICDLTHAYTETSGGIRTYIDAKRQFLLEHSRAEHLLIVPWSEDSVEREGRITTVRIKSPVIPGAAPYRMFVRPDKVRQALREFQPDLIELASLYASPWIAFAHRREVEAAGGRCAVSAFYHTDLPAAYVHPVAERIAGATVARWAKGVTTRYVESVFRRLDLALTASPAHAEELERFDIPAPVRCVPLGVDVDLFHPVRRSSDLRARFNATDDDLLLVFAGRLDNEKHIHTLVDTLERLPAVLNARLILVGEGPQREALKERAREIAADTGSERLFVLPYERRRSDLATLLASTDVYVTAGPHETFGLSVVEAQAAGLPVVGVEAGALRERVADGTGFLAPVDDPATMARLVTQAAFDREILGRNGRQHVERHFSWASTFHTISAHYEEVLAERIMLPAALRPATAWPSTAAA